MGFTVVKKQNIFFYIIQVIFGFLFISCSNNYQIIKTVGKNPTEYDFSSDMNLTRLSIVDALKKFQFRGMRLDSISLEKEYLINLFKLEEDFQNHNQCFFLYKFDDIGESYIYRDNYKGLPYFAAFHIHLTSINNQTQVSIITVKPRILVGYTFRGYVAYLLTNHGNEAIFKDGAASRPGS